jgi:hypothetical protein
MLDRSPQAEQYYSDDFSTYHTLVYYHGPLEGAVLDRLINDRRLLLGLRGWRHGNRNRSVTRLGTSRMSDSAQQRVYPTRRRQSVSQHVRNRWVMCGKCSPVSCGAGPCPARPRAAATSFFRACAGAIEKANRPSPETRAGTSRHGPCCAARKSGRTPHIHNPSTEPALLRVDCNSLTALRIIRSRNPSEQASGSEMKTPPK